MGDGRGEEALSPHGLQAADPPSGDADFYDRPGTETVPPPVPLGAIGRSIVLELVLDELGVRALDRHEAHLRFEVIADRYERGATIITSNKSVRDWPEMLAGDEVLTTAIPDRLLHHCHVVQSDGNSVRRREMEKKAS